MSSAASLPLATSTEPVAPPDPPRYVLVSHGALPDAFSSGALNGPVAGSSGAATLLSHPIIQYQYADDPPAAVLPRFPGERVIVLDADLAAGAPTARSISPGLAVMGVKVADAPGASVQDDEVGDRKMYVIDTMSIVDERCVLLSPIAILLLMCCLQTAVGWLRG